MSLTEIADLLQETGAAIAKAEPSLREYPHDRSVLLTLHSLKKRQEELESELLETANRMGMDVCSYRLLSDEDVRPTVSAFVKALGDFQHLFSVMYDAIKNGPKERASFTAETAKETAFGFGYTFAGSLGAVFTLPNERLLPGILTNIETTVEAIFKIAKAQEVSEIASIAKEIGKPPIRAAYTWARDHVYYGLGANIEWRRGAETTRSLLVQRPELDKLQKTIVLSSEEKKEEIAVRGMLEAADVRRHTFRILTEEGGDIRGWFRDAISEAHVVTIPKKYKATIRKTTRILYSTETEETSYFLVSLKPIE